MVSRLLVPPQATTVSMLVCFFPRLYSEQSFVIVIAFTYTFWLRIRSCVVLRVRTLNLGLQIKFCRGATIFMKPNQIFANPPLLLPFQSSPSIIQRMNVSLVEFFLKIIAVSSIDMSIEHHVGGVLMPLHF